MNEWCLRWNTFIFDNSLFWFSFGPFCFLCLLWYSLDLWLFHQPNVCLEHSKMCSFFHSNTQNQIAKLMFWGFFFELCSTLAVKRTHLMENYLFSLFLSLYGIKKKKQVCTHITHIAFEKCNQFLEPFIASVHSDEKSNLRLILFSLFI